MKVSELREKFIKGKLLSDYGIEIRNYLPIAEKKLMVDKIIEDCLDYNNDGLLKVNFVNKKIAIDLAFLLNYTSIELNGENFIDDYDFLDMNNVFDSIRDAIGDKEVCLIYDLIDEEIDQRIRLENSFEAILKKGINALIEKLPTDKQIKSLAKSLARDLKNFNWDAVPMIKEMYQTINKDVKNN